MQMIPLILGGIGAAGAIIGGETARAQETLRQRQLGLQQSQEKLQAMDQETNRRQQLRFAQSQTIASASARGRDPFASGSIRALRDFNVRETDKDIRSILLNTKLRQADLSVRQQASRIRRSSARASSLFQAARSGLGGISNQQALEREREA